MYYIIDDIDKKYVKLTIYYVICFICTALQLQHYKCVITNIFKYMIYNFFVIFGVICSFEFDINKIKLNSYSNL